MMQQADSLQPVARAPAWFNRLILLFGSRRCSAPRSGQVRDYIDWPDSDLDSELPRHGDRPVSGGYNEAFIVQHWTSYHLR